MGSQVIATLVWPSTCIVFTSGRQHMAIARSVSTSRLQKIEPVGPNSVESRVKPPYFRHHVNFSRVAVPAFDAEYDAAHHFAKPTALRQFIGRVQAEEMAEVAALHLRAAELVKDKVVSHAGLGSSSRRLGLLRRVWFARTGPLAEGEQVNYLHLQRLSENFQPGDGRGIDPALDQADELHRAGDPFCQLWLRQLPRLAQFRDPLAKFLLEHGFGIPDAGADGNGAKRRVAVSAIADGYAPPQKWFRLNGGDSP